MMLVVMLIRAKRTWRRMMVVMMIMTKRTGRRIMVVMMIMTERGLTEDYSEEWLPMGMTCDLQLVRQATGDLGRYLKDLNDSKRIKLILVHTDRNQNKVKGNEIKKKIGVII
jgi:hypothetical protein